MAGDTLFKEKFLKKVEKDYPKLVKGYYTLFSKGKLSILPWEEYFGKDFYDFTHDEVVETLKGFKSPSKITLNTMLSLLKRYSNYAWDEKVTIQPAPNTDGIDRSDLDSFVCQDKKYKKFMTQKELYDALPKLKNDIDKALLILLFKGIKGKDYCDLVDLQKECFSYVEKEIRLHGEAWKLTDWEADMIQDGIDQEEYSSYVERQKENDMYYKKYEIRKGNFIFRNIDMVGSKRGDSTQITSVAIKSRIKKACMYLDKPNWNGTSIHKSGLIADILNNYDNPSWVDLDEYKKENKLNFCSTATIEAIEVIKEKLELEKMEEQDISETDM